MKIKKRIAERIIYYGSLKKYYFCDGCHKIHKYKKKNIELNQKYGLFVSIECAEKMHNKVTEIMRNAIWDEINKMIGNGVV